MNSIMQKKLEGLIDLSIVIPVYNSAAIFPELYRRVLESIESVTKNFELIAVLDGCRDNSKEVIGKYCSQDRRVKMLVFSRNFGHQAAISAGLEIAKGNLVAVMDDDLEDPPEILREMMRKIGDGFDVVYGIRKRRKRSLLYRILYRAYYRVLSRMVDLDMPTDAGDFCVMRSNIVQILNKMPERNRYIRGLRAWSGFRQTGIEYNREERYACQSGYSLRKYIGLAFDAVFSFSYKPLKFVSITGIIIAVLSFCFGLDLIIRKLTGALPDVPGWASLVVSVLFLSGIQLVSLGIIGEYIARIYDEVKKRPKYIISQTINTGESLDDRTER